MRATDRVREMAHTRRIAIAADGVGARHVVLGDRRQLVSAIGNLLEPPWRAGTLTCLCGRPPLAIPLR